jgi:hypothetical protein
MLNIFFDEIFIFYYFFSSNANNIVEELMFELLLEVYGLNDELMIMIFLIREKVDVNGTL